MAGDWGWRTDGWGNQDIRKIRVQITRENQDIRESYGLLTWYSKAVGLHFFGFIRIT